MDQTKKNLELYEIKIMRITDVAEMLTLSESHIYRLVNQKKIPFHKKGKNLFFINTEILNWLTNGENQ